MCSASVVSTAVRVGTGVMTMGTSELARKVPGPIGSTAALPGNLAYVTAGGTGAPPSMPWDRKPDQPAAPTDAAGSSDSGGDAGAPPTPTPSSPTELAAMLAKRKLAALKMGLLSTITTSGAGLSMPTTPAPAAFATGLKTSLGQ